MILGTLKLHDSPDPGALLQAAERLGVRALDCADVYGHGHPHETERRLAGTALPVQTKAGLLRTGPRWKPCGTAKHLKTRATQSVEILGEVDRFFLHVIDPAAGLDRSWRALQKLKGAGLVPSLGLSNPRHHEVVRALELGDLDAVQLPLSPFKLDALETGIVRLCRENGVEVQAHSPLGGWRRKNHRVKVLQRIADEHGVSTERLALRWLEALGVEPVVGCTRVETLEDAMGPVPESAIAAACEAIPQSRFATVPPHADGDGHIVLIAGLPGAGKTTHARAFTEQGYARLNRDELGGTLKGLVKRLDALLESGERRVVLDNTWAERHIRHKAVMAAAKHGCSVTTLLVPTSIEQCQVQAVRRILADGRGLPEPDALKKGDPPHWLGPSALFNIAARWEPPTPDEGFEVDTLDVPTLQWGERAGVIANLDALESRDAFEGPLYAALWAPDPARRARVDAALAKHEVLDHRICTHPPGPPVCWCRKPQPGMAVDLMLENDLTPDQTVLIGGSAERTVAERLGARFEKA